MFELEFVSPAVANGIFTASTGKESFPLPICNLPGTDLYIIGFDSMGRSKLISLAAQALIDEFGFKDVDFIVCPEAKAIPVAQELARILNVDYFVLRKAKKLYMADPQYIEVHSITTEGRQLLWYDNAEAENRLKGKNVMLFDDVISTGSSFRALEDFAEKTNCAVTHKVAILKEGDSHGRNDVESLGYLPLISRKELEEKFGEACK